MKRAQCIIAAIMLLMFLMVASCGGGGGGAAPAQAGNTWDSAKWDVAAWGP